MRQDFAIALFVVMALAVVVTALSVELDVNGFSSPDGGLAWPRIIVTLGMAIVGVGEAIRGIAAFRAELHRDQKASDPKPAPVKNRRRRSAEPEARGHEDRQPAPSEDLQSMPAEALEERLAEENECLKWIRVRKQKFMVETDVPLHVLRDESLAVERIHRLEDELRLRGRRR